MIMIPIATQLIDVFDFVNYRAGRGMKKGLGWGSHRVSNKCRFRASDCSSVVTSLIGVHTLNCIGRKECSLTGTHNSLPETHCVSQAK